MSLKELLDARLKADKETLTKIFERIQPSVDGIVEFMEFDIVCQSGGQVVWTNVSYIEDDEEPFCVVIGRAFYPIGAEVELKDSSKVIVTEDTAPLFQRLIRVGLPLRILEGSKQDTIDYLKHKEDEYKIKEAEFRKQMEAQLEVHLLDKQAEKEAAATDFDLSQLTPEQLEQLKLLDKAGRG